MMRSLKLPSFFSFPLYLFLLPVFFVLHGFTENYFLVPVNDALLVLGKDMVAAGLLLFLTWIVFRSVQKAALLSFFLMCVYYFFGYVQDVLRTLFPESFLASYVFLLSLLFILIIIAVIYLRMRSDVILRGVHFFNILLILLIVMDFAWLILKTRQTDQQFFIKENIITQNNYSSQPDVYFIILDEYAGKHSLADAFGFDNSLFLEALSNRNFQVLENSRSNYNYTLYSMASVFSMDYLPVADDEKKADPTMAYRLLFDNPVVQRFKERGYEFYNQSWFDFRYQSSGFLNSFVPSRAELITSQTLFRRMQRETFLPLAKKLGNKKWLKQKKYENLHYNRSVFSGLNELASSRKNEPKFVYAHFAMPHFPFYFDRTGNLRDYEDLEKDTEFSKDRYLEFLEYTNGEMVKLIDTIMTASAHPPVIIIASDHGFRKHGLPDGDYDFMNLFSVHLPDGSYDQFNNQHSLVNLFRVLFNKLFSDELPLLPHKTRSINF